MTRSRKYSEEEMKAILERALRQNEDDGVSREELIAAAKEIGIDAGDVDRAIAEHEDARERNGEPASTSATIAQSEEEEIAREMRNADIRSFLWNLITYVVFFGAFFVFDPAFRWERWAMLGWGIGVVIQAIKVTFPSLESPRRTKRRVRREVRRRERRRKVEKWKQRAHDFTADEQWKRTSKEIDRASDHIERAVAEGLEQMFASIARGVENASQSKPPRVRVAQDDEERDEQDNAVEKNGKATKRR